MPGSRVGGTVYNEWSCRQKSEIIDADGIIVLAVLHADDLGLANCHL